MKGPFAVWWVMTVLVAVVGCGGTAEDEESTLAVLLEERPRLAEALAGHDQVQTWIESRFEPGALPVELIWDPSEPQGGQVAEHELLSEEGPASIRIGSGYSGLDQLTGLLYELNNLEDYPEFQLIYNAAVRGEIDRSEYARRMLAQEFEGLQRTRAFMKEHLSGHLEDSVNQNPMYFRVMRADTSLDTHVETYAKNGFELHSYYEQLYDQEIAPKREQE